MTYLGDNARKSHPLAKLKATGPALPTSRSIIWALARLNGYDPARWQLNGGTLLTWGGQTLNALLAAVFRRSAPDRNFSPSPTALSGDIFAIDLSIESIRDLAKSIEKANDLPLSVASKFVSPSRFMGELSDTLVAKEKRRAVPWALLHRWLDRVDGIETGSSMTAAAREAQ